MEIRVGLPQAGGAILQAARDERLPCLLSANAFIRRGVDRQPVGFRMPNASQFSGLDAALDSAGFVAMARYRGYDWSVESYLDLAAAHPWRWWAAMDCCMEPEIAPDRNEVLLRLAETARLLGLCNREAQRRGLPAPMPVVQGWRPADYLRCLDLMPLFEYPSLMGVGSVCRRAVGGPQGLLQVVETLDRALPKHVRLHLFGVKGTALPYLAGHPRVASVDSMAWDFAVRRAHPTGRTQALRIAGMRGWLSRQRALLAGPRRCFQPDLLADHDVGPDGRHEPESEVYVAWAELVACGEVEMQSAAIYAAREEAEEMAEAA